MGEIVRLPDLLLRGLPLILALFALTGWDEEGYIIHLVYGAVGDYTAVGGAGTGWGGEWEFE